MSTAETKRGLNCGLKLSIITQFYPPDYAATGQLIAELAGQLGKLDLFVNVFTGQPGYAFQTKKAPAVEHLEQLTIKRCTLPGSTALAHASKIWSRRIRGKTLNGLLFFLFSVLHLLKASNRGDVLLVTTAPPFLPLLGYLANKIFGLPYVCLLYDLYPDIAVKLNVVPDSNGLVRLWKGMNRRVWQRAQQVVVLSPSMKKRVVAHCPGIADKVTVVHSWADPNWIVPIAKKDNWFAQELNLVNTFTVLYSGNMGRCHDMETILEAVKLLRNEPIRFIFIGNGAKREALRSQVNQLGLGNCQFLPYQDKKDLPYSLTACDLSLVSISPGMEGLVAPSKFYGALASGRPVAVICEQHSYLRGMITEAGCGQAFDNGDGASLAAFIHSLARDAQLVEQMGQAGRYYIKCNFTPELIAKQYWKLLLCQPLFKSPQNQQSLHSRGLNYGKLPTLTNKT
ncbi:MAG: glycosyltransferase family 4 protein [Coleofasciculaceae cyanobacterium]